MIAGVVLAAGRSLRMGAAKALLPLGGESLLARWIGALRAGGCDVVLVVAGTGETGARVAEEARGRARVVVNRAAGSEQIDSLRAALRALPREAEAAVVTPVDVAEQSAAVVRALVDAWRGGAAPIVLPTFGGERGHPALFARDVFAELLDGELPEGARSVIRSRPQRVAEVPVDRPGVLVDVDTPEQYRRLLEERA